MPTPLERVFQAAECRTQLQLADFLGIKQSSISDAKKRRSIPSDWLLVLWRKKGINPDWILTGKGPKEFSHAEAQKISIAGARDTQAARPLQHCPTEELMAEVIRRVAQMWRKGMREV